MHIKELSLRECCFKTLPAKGRKLVWEITHKCNFGCSYCFQARKRIENPMRILNPSDLRVVITKLPELGISDVLITGGEIRWAKDNLPDICSHLQTADITYSVSTNFIHEQDFVDFIIDLQPSPSFLLIGHHIA